jgi:hypothetical protein
LWREWVEKTIRMADGALHYRPSSIGNAMISDQTLSSRVLMLRELTVMDEARFNVAEEIGAD